MTDAAHPVTPAVSNQPGQRSVAVYENVLNQFAVEHNPRYVPRDSNGDGKIDTFCNIFVWDATKAMEAEIPHWVSPDGSPTAVGAKGAHELNANGVARWLNSHGADYGWREVTAEEVQAAANEGKPAVVAWDSQSKSAGHVAMVRPGTYSDTTGPAIAQSGSRNLAGCGARSLSQGRSTCAPLTEKAAIDLLVSLTRVSPAERVALTAGEARRIFEDEAQFVQEGWPIAYLNGWRQEIWSALSIESGGTQGALLKLTHGSAKRTTPRLPSRTGRPADRGAGPSAGLRPVQQLRQSPHPANHLRSGAGANPAPGPDGQPDAPKPLGERPQAGAEARRSRPGAGRLAGRQGETHWRASPLRTGARALEARRSHGGRQMGARRLPRVRQAPGDQPRDRPYGHLPRIGSRQGDGALAQVG